MEDELLEAIKAFVQRVPPVILDPGAMLTSEDIRKLGYAPRSLFAVASDSDVAKAESELGFALPPILRRLFTEVSNGIDGFSYEFMGLEGGCSRNSGTLVSTYRELKSHVDLEYEPWRDGLLPFCNWGCAIYSCVDCSDPAFPVYTWENLEAWAEKYNLSEFFQMWLNGSVEFSNEGVVFVTREVTNPANGERITLSIRTRQNRSE